MWQAGNLGHIDELVVDSFYRGSGIGKKLLTSLINKAQKLKCKRIELDTAFHRKKAHQFYENMNFENRAFLFSRIIEIE